MTKFQNAVGEIWKGFPAMREHLTLALTLPPPPTTTWQKCDSRALVLVGPETFQKNVDKVKKSD